ncbi:hypothetical protein IT396_00605 [Candidatus Nomurabacteria bacterium]|nr:hypothetical protein [Candidatus Nomurabacteria bacterium]
MKRIAAVLILLMFPTFVFAASFAKQSIFLSRSSVTEGESVLIHAVVSNDESATFKGSLVLRDGEEKVGTVPVTLESGKAIAVSVSWEPAAGKRTVHADLLDQSGEMVETMKESFTIAEKPKPAVKDDEEDLSAAAIESSKDIQNKIRSVSPGTSDAVAPVFTMIDSARSSAADVLDGQLTLAKKKLGQVEGAQTEEGALPETVGGFWLALWTLYLYVLTVLRFLIGNAAFFYPVFALLFFFILYRTFRRFRR